MQKHVSIPIQAPYHTLNDLTSDTDTIWLVCHGQGQLAEYFIKKWEGLDTQRHFILAPQGLSKYYLNGFTGRVGASWMTREDRLTEIENQQVLLRTIWDKEVGNVGDRRVIFFGFSQGVATISRFAAFSKIPFDVLVLWAGTFPPDIPEGGFDHLTGKEEIIYYTAKDDPYFKPEMPGQQREAVTRTMGKDPQVRYYEGGHKVIPDLLTEL